MAITHTPSFTLGNYSVHACKCVSTCVVQSRARPQTGLLLRAKNCKLFGSAQSAEKRQRKNDPRKLTLTLTLTRTLTLTLTLTPTLTLALHLTLALTLTPNLKLTLTRTLVKTILKELHTPTHTHTHTHRHTHTHSHPSPLTCRSHL